METVTVAMGWVGVAAGASFTLLMFLMILLTVVVWLKGPEQVRNYPDLFDPSQLPDREAIESLDCKVAQVIELMNAEGVKVADVVGQVDVLTKKVQRVDDMGVELLADLEGVKVRLKAMEAEWGDLAEDDPDTDSIFDDEDDWPDSDLDDSDSWDSEIEDEEEADVLQMPTITQPAETIPMPMGPQEWAAYLKARETNSVHHQSEQPPPT